jgi:Holliday junction resolvasome RuvABC ATP-dependent DNA helicase subunit
MPLTPEMLAQIADRQSNIGADLDHHERSRRRTVVKRGTEIFEGGDYPHTFDEFVGQAEAKTQLRTAIASAQARGAPLDHVLLASGAQGIGKTTLAQIIAAELGVGLVSVSGAMTVNDARTILLQMRPGDVLFWDEFHLAVSGNSSPTPSS